MSTVGSTRPYDPNPLSQSPLITVSSPCPCAHNLNILTIAFFGQPMLPDPCSCSVTVFDSTFSTNSWLRCRRSCQRAVPERIGNSWQPSAPAPRSWTAYRRPTALRPPVVPAATAYPCQAFMLANGIGNGSDLVLWEIGTPQDRLSAFSPADGHGPALSCARHAARLRLQRSLDRLQSPLPTRSLTIPHAEHVPNDSGRESNRQVRHSMPRALRVSAAA